MQKPIETSPAPLLNVEPTIVTHSDGTKESVTMRRLSIRQLYTFAELIRDNQTPQLVSLCAEKPLQWIDTLTDDSFGDLTDRCVTANFHRAMTIGNRDPVMASLIGPAAATGLLSISAMLPALVAEQLQKINAGTLSSDRSTEPASSDCAGAIPFSTTRADSHAKRE